jgi:hypothetical protein
MNKIGGVAPAEDREIDGSYFPILDVTSTD